MGATQQPAQQPAQRTARDSVRQIAEAVLYEGYVLWPYRRSAAKNQQRWTFGGVYPAAYSELQAGSDPCLVRTECLVAGDDPVLDVTVRFLHLVERRVGRKNASGNLDFVDELRVDGERYLAWEEATEREVATDPLRLATPQAALHRAFRVPRGTRNEPIAAASGEVVGTLARAWAALAGVVEISALPVSPGLFRVRVTVRNTTRWQGHDRASAQRQTLLSAHAVLRVMHGDFISLMEPPQDLKQAAEQCQQVKLWPVLTGEDSDRHIMLAAPIILYDYPQIAPESPGDLFDGTEIDQLLILNILTLTEDEKAEVRATDPRTRAILERSESLGTDDFMRLHGAIRDFRVLRPGDDLPPTFGELEAPAPKSVTVRGTAIRPGSRVWLRPKPGGDIMDIALAGQVACVEAIEQDYEGTIHLAVTVESDPGRDLGRERQIGHRFFFALDEVEPLEPAATVEPVDGMAQGERPCGAS